MKRVVRGLPSETAMMLPLLAALDERGGSAAPRDVYDVIAAELAVPSDVRDATERDARGRIFNSFERRVRWTRQTAVVAGLIAKERRGRWDLTDRSKPLLENARRGTVVTVFETERGVAIWANVEDAIAYVEPSSLQLIFSSPPYPLLEKKKAYGNLDARAWVEWMLRICGGWRELLTPDGSVMLNVGPTWNPGLPTQSTYIERLIVALEDELGLHLCQRLYWQNTTKLPQPREWVAIRRVRVKPSIEPILWFSANPHAAADNRRVLVPYAESTIRGRARGTAGGVERRPSGIDVNRASFARDNGGAIPPELLRVSNGARDRAYRKAVAAAGLPTHPAIFPREIVEFGVKLTTARGQRVGDFFGGSGVVGAVCEDLDREWVVADRSLAYLRGAQLRFPAARPVMAALSLG